MEVTKLQEISQSEIKGHNFPFFFFSWCFKTSFHSIIIHLLQNVVYLFLYKINFKYLLKCDLVQLCHSNVKPIAVCFIVEH